MQFPRIAISANLPSSRGLITLTIFACGLLGVTVPVRAQAHSGTPPCTGPAVLEKRLKTSPDAQTWAMLGNYFGEHSQFPCAANAFRSAVRLSPSSAQFNYLLGLALYQSQRFEDAVPPLHKSVKLDPTVLATHLLLGSVFDRLGQHSDAETEFRAALAIDHNSSIALHGLSQAFLGEEDYASEIDLLSSARLDEALSVDLALAYSKTGRVDDAIAVITKAMETAPTSVDLSTTLVSLYSKKNRTDEAERVAQKAYEAHPDDFKAQISYMKTLVLNGDWNPARPLGKKLLEENPHDFQVLYLNGVLERQDGEYSAARDHLTEAAGLDPNVANLYYNLGVALARLHDPTGAIDQLRLAVSHGDKQPEVHFELANALRATGQLDEAKQEMATYQDIVKQTANNTIAASKSSEAAAAMDKGDIPRAVQLLRDAFTATPKDALTGYRLAMALDAAGNQEEERTVLNQVIALDPDFAGAQNQLGYLDSRRGDNASAEEHFRRAVQSAPAFTQAWISLGATLGMEGKFPEAQQAVANALHLDPKNAQALELSHELASAAQGPQSHN